MRICIVSQEYPPVSEYHGGIGTQYGRLAPALAALGHELHVITLAPPGGAETEVEVEGVSVHPLVRPRLWPWFELLWGRRIEAKLRELGRFDFVVSPEFRGEAALYARNQANGPLATHLLTSLRQLLTIRPGLTRWERHGPRTRLQLWVERTQAERSTALLAPGQAVLDWASDLWSLDELPTRILPLTIGVDEVLAAAEHGPLPAGFPERGPTVTFASRMDGHKGTQHLVRAMKSVWRSHPDAQLVFVGRDARWQRGMMSDHLRELAGERIDQVHVLGYQEPGPYFAAVAASDLIAIPSLWESYCLAAVEAMTLGRPVIGTTGHGFSEFMEDGRNGLLVTRGSVPELATAVTRLLDDQSLRTRLGRAAAATGRAHTPEKVAPLYVSALAETAPG
jgi:glycosyltransferase involved in cell wall biosynthesis